MSTRCAAADLVLPRGWSSKVRSAVLHAISLTAIARASAGGRAAGSSPLRRLQAAETDRLRIEIHLLAEEPTVKDARWGRLAARRRPHYGPVHGSESSSCERHAAGRSSRRLDACW